MESTVVSCGTFLLYFRGLFCVVEQSDLEDALKAKKILDPATIFDKSLITVRAHVQRALYLDP